MPLSVAPILSSEPAAYFEEVEAGFPALAEGGFAGESVDRVQLILSEVIVPILKAVDLAGELTGRWEKFKEFRDELVQFPLGDGEFWAEDILRREDGIDAQLRAIFEGSSGEFSKGYIRPVLGGLQLRRVVRETVLPEVETWPDDSLEKIGGRMVLNELCLACVLHHLAAGVGSIANAKFLAGWSYYYAEYAYAEAGFSGKNHVSESGAEPV